MKELSANLKRFFFLIKHIYEVIRIGSKAKLRKLDTVLIPNSVDEIRMFMIIRNEVIRLPQLLKYYRDKGVNRFFMVDNGSSDGTVEFLLSQKDVHVFSTIQSFREAKYGLVWMNVLLYKYGLNHWCVINDADELFIFPHSEELSFRDLACYMDQREQTVLNAIFLDMYTDLPLSQAEYRSGEDLLEKAPYFDRDGYDYDSEIWKDYSGSIACTGGVRRRVFGIKEVCLCKVPFVKFRYDTIFDYSYHCVSNGRSSDIFAAVLHFKYFSNFISLAKQEAKRQEHWDKAAEYKAYDAILESNRNINLYSPEHSVKFESTQQLIELNLMKTSSDFEAFVQNRDRSNEYYYQIREKKNILIQSIERIFFLSKHIIEMITIGLRAELRKMDTRHIPALKDEIRMFMVIRNEEIRLPYVLKYYREKGVNRFFVVDNGSTDGTRDFLLSQEDVHIFLTHQSYNKAKCGQVWMNMLLHKYGVGHWCVLGDADELFIYPHSETLSLKELANYMDQRKENILNSFFLDMYTDKPLSLSDYQAGEDPLLKAPYFDRNGYVYVINLWEEYSGSVFCRGGVRSRVFGMWDVCLNKVPLVKFDPKIVFDFSCHYAHHGRPTDLRAATLHFKYFSNLIPLAKQEAQREEHYDKAVEYKAYEEFLMKNQDVNLYSPDHSVKFRDSQQLVELNIMRTSSDFEGYVRRVSN